MRQSWMKNLTVVSVLLSSVFIIKRGDASYQPKSQIIHVSTRRVPFSSHPGCQQSRQDVVPASDADPNRYHRYDSIISLAAKTYRLPSALIWAFIKTESDFDPHVVSCAEARGLMQLIPIVAQEQKVEHPFDPSENIMGGSRLLRELANRFSGDLVKTIAGYHAGAGAVERYKGIPPYSTTKEYVAIVLKHYQDRNTKADLPG